MLTLHRSFMRNGVGESHKTKKQYTSKIYSRILFIVAIVLSCIAFKQFVFATGDSPVGKLNVTYSSGSVEQDIVDNHFELSTQSGTFATIKINAEFNAGEQKKITANIPTGFKVLSYSALPSTPEMNDVTKVEIDNAYQGYIKDVALTAATSDTHVLDSSGNQVKFAPGSDWQDQAIPGYAVKIKGSPDSISTGYNVTDQRVYGGDIEWTFVDTTTKVELIFTVAIDNLVLNHTADTEEMDPITVKMNSTKDSLTEDCLISATNIQIFSLGSRPLYPGARMYNVGATSDIPNRSEQFGIGAGISLSNSVASSISQYTGSLIDELIATFNYPQGVYYDDVLDATVLGTTITTREFDDDYISVRVNEDASVGGGTVVVTLKNFIGGHSTFSTNYARIVAYFRADNTIYDINNQTITPKPSVEYSYRRNGVIKNSDSPTTYDRKLTYSDGKRDVAITAKNLNLRNLDEEFGNVPFNYLLGGFRIESALDYSNVKLRYTFENLGVRDITLPGKNIRNMSATLINQTTGATREIAIEDLPTSIAATLSKGVVVEGDKIGLEPDEYIIEYNVTVDLEQGNYSTQNYTQNAGAYFGNFVSYDDEHMPLATLSVIDSNTGEIETNSSDVPMTATDRTTFGWTQARSGNLNTTVRNAQNQVQSTFYPNESIYVTGTVNGTNYIGKNTNEVVDPTIIISLPEGIELNLSSVQAKSADGNKHGERFSLVQKSAPTTILIDGVKWKTYYYKSEDPLALVSKRQSNPTGTTTNSTPLYVYFQAIVGINAPHYNLSLKDILSYDLGKTAATGSSLNSVYPDYNDRAGKNVGDTTYNLAAAGSTIQIKPLIGLNIDIGIRTKGFNQDFMTYNGTESGIAVVSRNNTAEVKIRYESTSNSVFKEGSVIYMPVPKKGIDYNKYFENIELTNPLVDTENVTFAYSTKLASIPTLVGNDGTSWTTYLATNITGSNSQDYSAGDGNWEPVESEGGTPNWVEATEYTGELDDVIMMKFVSNSPIAPGDTGECTYDLVLDTFTDVEGDGIDYWRTYNKAVTENDNTGIWNYSSVIAVNARGVDLEGQIFIDSDNNARFADPDSPYENSHITILLSRDDNTEPTRSLAIDEYGHFTNRSIAIGTEEAADFVLKEGDYTLTIILEDSETTFGFSRHESASESNNDTFYNDIKLADIADDGRTAIQRFTVNPNSFTTGDYMMYTGIALNKQNLSVTYEWDGALPTTAVLPRDEKIYQVGELVTIDSTYTSDYRVNDELDGESGTFVFSGWEADDGIDDDGCIVDNAIIRGTWVFVKDEPEPDDQEDAPGPEVEPEVEEIPTPDTGQNTAVADAIVANTIIIAPIIIIVPLAGLYIRHRVIRKKFIL